MEALRFFIISLLLCPLSGIFAQEIKPLYRLPSTSYISSETEQPYLAGSDKGLYKISVSNTAIPLWAGGKVEQILRVETKDDANTSKELWYFRTSAGILYSEDLVNFELRNNGIESFMIKKYDGTTTTLVPHVPMLKDLCVDPLNPQRLVTATENNVYITSDGGISWSSLSSSSPRTPGIKAVAVATMESGEVVVFESHPVFGLAYILPYIKNAKWTDVTNGIKIMQSLSSPDEIADIFPMIRTRDDGTKYVEIYFSQSYLPCIYRFDWKNKKSIRIYEGTEPADSIDGITSVGNALLFTRIESLGAIDVTTLATLGVPANFEEWKKNLSFIPGMVNTAWIPQYRSGFSEGVLLNELWMLYPGTINTPYAELADGKKGIYVSAYQCRNQTGITKFKKIINDNNLNALVIDMKDDYGLLRYHTHDSSIAEKAQVSQYAVNLEHFVKEFKESKTYLIARIVVFKDRNLSRYANGKYAVWDAAAKSPWIGIKAYEEVVDSTTGNSTKKTPAYYDEHWVDPYSPEVWEYNVAIAKELINRGFDEIQFDYIRFPTDGINLNLATYRWQAQGMTKESALISFLLYARENIDAPIGIDIYGANGWYRSGTRTGQDAEMLCEYVDVISPMFYPSHFEQEFMNHEPYADRTYRIYYYGTYRTSVMTRNRAIARPWVQAFRLNVRYDRQYYGTAYIQKEIFGVRDAADRGYLYWNNSGDYDYILPDITTESKYIGTAREAATQFRKPAIGNKKKMTFADETISILDSILEQEERKKTGDMQYTPFLYVPFMKQQR